jgi:hypothetical protein
MVDNASSLKKGKDMENAPFYWGLWQMLTPALLIIIAIGVWRK